MSLNVKLLVFIMSKCQLLDVIFIYYNIYKSIIIFFSYFNFKKGFLNLFSNIKNFLIIINMIY